MFEFNDFDPSDKLYSPIFTYEKVDCIVLLNALETRGEIRGTTVLEREGTMLRLTEASRALQIHTTEGALPNSSGWTVGAMGPTFFGTVTQIRVS